MSESDGILFGIKAVFVIAAVVLVVVYLVAPMLRMLAASPELPDLHVADLVPDDLMEENELQIPADGDRPNNQSIIEEARADPRRTAVLVSQWLREKK